MDLSKMKRVSPDMIIDLRGQPNADGRAFKRMSLLGQFLNGVRLTAQDLNLFPNTLYEKFGLSDPEVALLNLRGAGILTEPKKK
jgi:hypothetical protein